MRTGIRSLLAGVAGFALCAAPVWAGGLAKGTPDLKSAGALAFGPDGLLLVGDSQGAAIFAIETGDRGPASAGTTIKVEGVDQKIADLLGVKSNQLLINDLAVNPASGKAYLSVARGRGPDATAAIVRVDRSGKVEEMPLKDVAFTKAELPSPPKSGADSRGQNPRNEAITDLAFVDGRVFVAGLSNEEFSSRLLAIPYPFGKAAEGASIEIYHGAHGRFETKSPVRTFVAEKVGNETCLLAAYTCTPLVKIPVNQLKANAHVKGTTIAELGNMNRPLDMVSYQKDGKPFLLLANNSRGVMKIPTTTADTAESISAPVTGGGTKGIKYETIAALKGVMQLDGLDEERAVVLVKGNSGLNLTTIDLP